MKPRQRPLLPYLALVVSILALLTSFWSVVQVRESFQFAKTQTLISKENELHLLLLQADRLGHIQSRLILDILGILDNNPGVAKKHSNPRSYYKEKLDRQHKYDDLRFQILTKLIKREQTIDITFLEHSVGLCKLHISGYAQSNEDLQKDLLSLQHLTAK